MITLLASLMAIWYILSADPWSAAPADCTENGGQCQGADRPERTVA